MPGLIPISRGHSILVVASDAPAKARARAKYKCFGSNDEVPINLALTEAAADGGGIVELSIGTFDIDDPIVIPSDVTLRGNGWQTKLVFALHTDNDSSHMMITNSQRVSGNTNIVVENFYVDGNKGTASGDPGTDPSDDGQDGWDTTTYPDTDGMGNRGCLDFRAVDHLVVRNCRIDDGWAAGIELQHCHECWIKGNRIYKSSDDGIGINIGCYNISVSENVISHVAVDRKYGGPQGIEVQDGAYNVSVFANVVLSMTDSLVGAAIMVGSHDGQDGCYNVSIASNVLTDVLYGVLIESEAHNIAITGNTVTLDASIGTGCVVLNDCDHVAITGNTFEQNGRVRALETGTIATATDIVVSGNTFVNTPGTGTRTGIRLSGTLTRWLITGNMVDTDYTCVDLRQNSTFTDVLLLNNVFSAATNGVFIRQGGSTYSGCVLADCTFTGNTIAVRPYTTEDTDMPAGFTLRNCVGAQPRHEREYVAYKNTSGGELVAGDVVILKVSGGADLEFTTTTVAGDAKVLGVVAETIANGAYGQVQTRGKIITLKADGTDDIAVDDLLSTFTTAKIAQKAAAGEVVFGIAMEAYTTDDSSGVIDAFLISPRQAQ